MSQIATVKSISGTAFVVGLDGQTRPLKAGDKIQKGETIVTSADGRVELDMDGGGQPMAVGPAQTVKVEDSVAEATRPEPQQASTASGTVDSVIQALEQGGDLNQELEATAAGAGGGGGEGGGSSFVRLLRISEGVDPLSYQFATERPGLTDTPEGDDVNRLPTIEIDPRDPEFPEGDPEGRAFNDEVSESGIPGGSTEGTGNTTYGSFRLGDPDGLNTLQSITVSGVGGPVTFALADLAAGPGPFTVQGEYGILSIVSYNPATGVGVYRYELTTRSNDGPGDETDNFLLTVTDNRGGTSAPAGITITIVDDLPVAGKQFVQLDDDNLWGGNPGGWGDDARHGTSGVLPHDYHADGAGSLLLSGVNLPPGFTWRFGEGEGGQEDRTVIIISQAQGGNSQQPAFQSQEGGNGEGGYVDVVRIQLEDTTSGAYKVTQLAPVDHPKGQYENNVFFGVTYVVTDADNDQAEGKIIISVDDDTPYVQAVGHESFVKLTVDETRMGQSDSASFFWKFTGSYGADGPADTNARTYTLDVKYDGVGSGLYDLATGKEIKLYMEDGAVHGKVNGQTAFVLTVNDNGLVTLSQMRPLKHPDSRDHDEGVTLKADDLITLTKTLTDGDGDRASASIGIGKNLVFEDDGPSVSKLHVNAEGGVKTDETHQLGQWVTGAASVYVGGVVDLGADGGTKDVSLRIDSSDTGLRTTDGNHAIKLVVDPNNNNIVYGKYDSNNNGTLDKTAFTIKIDEGTGKLSVKQDVAIKHPDATNPDDPVNLAGKLSVVVSAKDGDNDTASQGVGIGNQIVFEDDGPTVSEMQANKHGKVVTDESHHLGQWVTSSSAAFTGGVVNLGKDGGSKDVSLRIDSSDTGLRTTDGNHAIKLVVDPNNNNIVYGKYDSNNNGTLDKTAFTIKIDESGKLSVKQDVAIKHPDATNPDDPVNLAGKLSVVVSAKDGDNDTASQSVGIGNQIVFEDDGPDAKAKDHASASATLDETGGFDIATISGQAIAALFHAPSHGQDGPGSVSYALTATDGARTGLWLTGQSGSANEIKLVKISDTEYQGKAGDTLAFSIKIDPATGKVTVQQFAALEHKVDGSSSSAHDDSLSLSDAAGVKVVQKVTDADGDSDTATSDKALKISFKDDGPDAKAKDHAFVSATLDETGGFDTATIAGTAVAALFHAPSHGQDGPGSVSYALTATDGARTGLWLTGQSGSANEIKLVKISDTEYQGKVGGSGALAFSVKIDPSSGEVTVQQFAALEHKVDGSSPSDHDDSLILSDAAGIKVVQKVTDADGDWDTATSDKALKISFKDDGPHASDDSDSVKEGDAENVISGTVSFGYGTDGAGTLNWATVSGAKDAEGSLIDGAPTLAQLGQLVTTNGTGAWEFTLNNDSTHTKALKSGDSLHYTVTYTVTDADGDSVTKTLTITVNGQSDGPVVESWGSDLRVSEEGLQGGVIDNTPVDPVAAPPYGDSTDATTASTNPDGGVKASDPDGDTLAYTLTEPAGVYTSGGETIVWTGSGTSTLIGHVGAADGPAAITITIDSDGNYSATLSKPIDQPNGFVTDPETALSIPIGVSVSDGGETLSGSFNLIIEDDSPTAVSPEAKEVTEGSTAVVKSNVMLIIDDSASMAGTLMNQVKAAVADLLGSGKVNAVYLVSFGTDGRVYNGTSWATSGGVWLTNLDTAETAVNNLSANQYGTDYDAALRVATTGFPTPPGTGLPLVSMFLSDGQPNESDGTGSNGITLTEEATWIDFLTGQGFSASYAFGFGGLNATNQNALEPIAWKTGEVAGTHGTGAADSNVTIVTDTEQLGNVLIASVPTVPETGGNVLMEASVPIAQFGADGGHILSITVNGTTYTWNGKTGGDSEITKSGASTGTIDDVTNLVDIPTGLGGKLSFNFATGDWGYIAPSNVPSDQTEQFTYALVDGDGDVLSTGAGGQPLAITVNVLNTHEAPSGQDAAVSIAEDGSKVFSLADFGFADNDGDDFVAVQIVTLSSVANGKLMLNGVAVTAGQEIQASDIQSGLLVFTPAANANGSNYANFTFKVKDSGSTAGGGANLDPTANTITIHVTPDAAPTANNDLVLTAINNNDTFTLPTWALTNNDTAGADGAPVVSGVNSNNSNFDSVTLSSGNVIVDTDGTFDPSDNASFTYTINDGSPNSSATGTVSVTAVSNANITGSNNAEIIVDNNNAHVLMGNGGNDIMFGNGGNDTLDGGLGNDILVGGAGADVFKWSLADPGSVDVVKDFTPSASAPTFQRTTITLANPSGDNDYDIGDVVSITINDQTFSHTVVAGQRSYTFVRDALESASQAYRATQGIAWAESNNVITLTGQPGTANAFAVSAAVDNSGDKYVYQITFDRDDNSFNNNDGVRITIAGDTTYTVTNNNNSSGSSGDRFDTAGESLRSLLAGKYEVSELDTGDSNTFSFSISSTTQLNITAQASYSQGSGGSQSWNSSDVSVSMTTPSNQSNPAVNNTAVATDGQATGDVLDLRDLLSNETPANLTQYLSFDDTGGKLVLNVDTNGSEAGGSQQSIVLDNYASRDALAVALGLTSGSDDGDILSKMVQQGHLRIGDI